MSKILTVCSKGLVRSVGMADVLKLHFEPVDVLTLGIDSNSFKTIDYLINQWADSIIVMHAPYLKRVRNCLAIYRPINTVYLCEVGPDTYKTGQHPDLIRKCWDWLRENRDLLGIDEHTRSI